MSLCGGDKTQTVLTAYTYSVRSEGEFTQTSTCRLGSRETFNSQTIKMRKKGRKVKGEWKGKQAKVIEVAVKQRLENGNFRHFRTKKSPTHRTRRRKIGNKRKTIKSILNVPNAGSEEEETQEGDGDDDVRF